GEFVVMGDADASYDFSGLDPFLSHLRQGSDLVVGNRFRGGIAPGAMPALHRYLGNPLLSFLGRLFFRAPIGDIYCGLRGMRRSSVLGLQLSSKGMEFANEMVAKAVLDGQRVTEVPTTLSPDGRSRRPHLRSFRDGWRTIRFLFLFCPNWLYLVPGVVLMSVGLALTVFLVIGQVRIGDVVFDVGTLIYCAFLAATGYQAVLFGILSKAYARAAGFQPSSRLLDRIVRLSSIEAGLITGFVLLVSGIALAVVSFLRWQEVGFGELATSQHIRVILPAALGFFLGVQTILGVLFLGAMTVGRRAPMSPKRDWVELGDRVH
ncbi:MAG: glycosyltransferase family 2 protein, partial [Actinobacteria bacterium]|nr:glycosyltransferase family 2 protein [Actinomycetota bacterium]